MFPGPGAQIYRNEAGAHFRPNQMSAALRAEAATYMAMNDYRATYTVTLVMEGGGDDG